MKIEYKCPECGKIFMDYPSNKRKYCSPKCSHKNYHPSKEAIKKMVLTRKGYRHSEESKKKMSLARKGKSNGRLGKHHSEKTKSKISLAHKNYIKRLGLTFEGKGNPFYGRHHTEEYKKKSSIAHKGKPSGMKGKYHSEEARRKMGNGQRGKTGEKAAHWKGGLTSSYLKIRTSDKYLKWRQDIFIRDNFTCRKCGDSSGGNLNAHHIKPFHKLLQEIRDYLPLYGLYDGAMIYAPLWDINNGITLCNKCHRHNKYARI